MAGPTVEVQGSAQDGVQQPSVRVRHSLTKTSTASFSLRGPVDAIPVPAYGDTVGIMDGSGATVFSGFVRSANADLSDSGEFFEDVRVRCQGDNDRLRYAILTGVQGVEIVEADNGEAQFDAILALLSGYTGATDLDSGSVAVRTDIRYQPAAAVLRALAVANDAILHVTAGQAIRLFRRANLSASALGRLGGADVFQIGLFRDPRKTRSRQLLRYGESAVQRTIPGDGSTRAFAVAGVQVAVDYMAAGVAAKALNADTGDQGLRMRADADAAARTGGGIDFFGGNAGDPASGLYVGATLAAAADVSLRMLTDGKLQLRAGVEMAAAAGYAIALRHDGSGTPVWTSDGITPTIETEGGSPTRDADADFILNGVPGALTRGQFAVHGDLVLMYRSDDDGQSVFGFRRSGTALVRDSRFDASLPAQGEGYGGMFVVGSTLHMGITSQFSGDLDTIAYTLGSGTIVRSLADDIGETSPFGTQRLVDAFVNEDQTTLWVTANRQTWRAFTIGAGDSLTRESDDDFTISGLGELRYLTRGLWHKGGWIYYCLQPTFGVGAVLLRRVRISDQMVDSNEVSMGSDFFSVRGILGFGGRVYTLGPGVADSSLPGGGSSSARAVRVESEYLEWDAPTADYNTLNTRRAADSGFRVAVMDPDIFGVSVPDADFTPIPVDVRSVRRVTLNGTREDLGEGQAWRFDRARQKIIQDPGATALTSTDSLVVEYAARAIAQACNPMAAVMRDDFAELRDSEGLTSTEALAAAEAFIERYGPLADRVSASLRDKGRADIAETLQFNSAFLRALGLADAADADEWLIYEVALRWSGDVLLQRLECQRGEFRERAVDWWRDNLEDVGG